MNWHTTRLRTNLPATRYMLPLLIIGILATRAAAVVDFSASVDRHSATIGDRIQLEVRISSDTRNIPGFDLPPIPGVSIISTGSEQNFQMVNNTVTISKTWTYSLLINAEMDIRIPALEIKIDGRKYTSAPILITGIKGARSPVSGRVSSDTDSTRYDVRKAARKAGDAGRFATLQADLDTVYIGEQVVLVFRYYEDARIRSFNSPQYTPPKTEGFWREELSPNRNYSETIDGHRYNITEIRYALFPTRDGTITITPARVVIQQDPFAGFFGRNRRARSGPDQITTSGLEIHVLTLPIPRPPAFSGLVSRNVQLRTTLDRDSVPAGEALSLKIELLADGSLKTLTNDLWTAPEGIRAHAAGQEFQNGAVSGRLISSLTQEWVLVPMDAGLLELPPVEISYFDPKFGSYKTLAKALGSITISPGNGNFSPAAFSGISSGELARLADDLAFVHSPGGRLRLQNTALDQRLTWRFLILLPFLLLLVLRIVLVRLDNEKRDPLGTRRRRALVHAQRSLAGIDLSADPVVSHAILAAVIDTYVGDKTGRSAAGLRKSDIRTYAASLGLSDIGERLQQTIDLCDSVRFASADNSVGRPFTDLRDQVATDLRKLEKAIGRDGASGNARPHLVLLILILLSSFGISDRTNAAEQRFETIPEGNPERLVAEGVQAYTAGDLDQALLLFQAADRLVNDATVYYNLGNTHARRGEIGLAILNYNRALRLTPRDRDLKTNLERIRSRATDARLHESASPILLSLLTDAVGALSRNEWDILLLIAAWWLCIYVAFAWWRSGYIGWYRRILIFSLVVLVVLVAISGTYWYRESVRDSAVVVKTEVDVRSGPEDSFPVVFKIHDGLLLEIADRRDTWCQISLGGEWNGWVPASAVVAINEQTDR